MKKMTFSTKMATAAATLILAVSAIAQTTADLASGEVRRVDKAAGKITLKHGEIKSMDMPAMTMVFQVRDPALLDKVKPGDKVRFNAESRDGAIVITTMEAAP